MKERYWLIGLLLLAALAACQPETTGDSPPALEPTQGVLFPRPTVTPRALLEEDSPAFAPEGYPGPPIPTVDTGYPAPQTPLPTIDPYPAGGFIWVVVPVGEQCASVEENEYADLQAAIAGLAAAGVPVKTAGTTELIVCASCGCPTSAHYRAQIEAANLDKAEAIGWSSEEQE